MATKLEGASHVDAWGYPPEELYRIKEVLNLRHGLRNIEELAWSIASKGQEQLGLIRKNAQGEPVLIAGHRRLAAIRLINEDPSRFNLAGPMSFKCTLKKATDEEAIELNLSENLDRDDLSTVDRAYAARQLEEILGWDRSRIATRLGVGASRVAGMLKIFELPARVIRLVHEGSLKESHAQQFFRGLPEEQVEAFADRIEAGEKPVTILRELKSAHRERGTRKARTLSEVRAALADRGDRLATNILAYLDGDPTVPTLEAALEGARP